MAWELIGRTASYDGRPRELQVSTRTFRRSDGTVWTSRHFVHRGLRPHGEAPYIFREMLSNDATYLVTTQLPEEF